MDFLLAIVISLGIFVGYKAQQAENLNFACQNGEEYDMCRSPCEPTCNSIASGITLNCTQNCVAGCFCRDGYVRANDRTCIPLEDCNARTIPNCRENEEFRECGSPCVANCSTINDPIFCTKPCYSGCFCKQDFVRDSRGNCVHPRNCYTTGYKQCPVNEQYVNCIDFCNTCLEGGDCRSRYCTPGCDCKIGFHRNFFGQCVTAAECFSPFYDSPYASFRGYCEENEVYTDCVNLCNDCEFKGRCNFEFYCEPGCDCKLGYYRDQRGVCVPEQFCPRRKPACPIDEQYYVCIPTCRATCDTFKDSSVICDTSCIPGCFCKGGLVRRNDGKCVPYADCPARNPTCPSGEVLYQCLPTCRTTCDSLNNTGGICSTECQSGCFCQPGFVKNTAGKCVRPQECADFTTPDSLPFDSRRAGTDGEDLMDTTLALSTENDQNVTETPTQTDSNSTSSSVPDSTALATFAVTGPVTTTFAPSDPATIATFATSDSATVAASDPATVATFAASDPATAATHLAPPATDNNPNETCGDACVTPPNTAADKRGNAETTALKETSATSSGNTFAGVTILTTNAAETLKTETNDGQTVTTNSVVTVPVVENIPLDTFTEQVLK